MMLNTARVVRNLCVHSQPSLLGQLIKCKLTLKVNDNNAVCLETLADYKLDLVAALPKISWWKEANRIIE